MSSIIVLSIKLFINETLECLYRPYSYVYYSEKEIRSFEWSVQYY